MIVKRMIDELHAIDTGKHEVIIKWQLFEHAGQNIPLSHEVFMWAYDYAKLHGYQTTASVFDKASLDFLLGFDIPFVKLANRRDLDWLVGEVPRRIRIYQSFGGEDILNNGQFGYSNIEYLCCVSEYPATTGQYMEDFNGVDLEQGISDHTMYFNLWDRYEPLVYEVHYKLPDSKGLDAGKFARTPKQLREIL